MFNKEFSRKSMNSSKEAKFERRMLLKILNDFRLILKYFILIKNFYNSNKIFLVIGNTF